MFLIIFIAFLSLIGLIILHEFSHFIVAKKFGVKVEEFGIFLPPRLFAKKIGETVYSINLLPLGAFVKLYGEEEKIENSRSFSGKPVWQRALIVVAGVVSFWIVSIILLTLVMRLGTTMAISDEFNENLQDPKVQIVSVASDSPAERAGLKVGDAVRGFLIGNEQFSINKVGDLQELTEKHKGEEIILIIERGEKTSEIALAPRLFPPEGEGAIGISLVRTSIKSYSWREAPIQGTIATGNMTIAVIEGWADAFSKFIKKEPTGVEMMGLVGILDMFGQAGQLGVNYFLQFVALISIYIALFNILPIPALDGGKLVFLGIEAARKKPISVKIEQQITGIFFILLIILMIIVNINDILRIFRLF